MRNHIQEIHLNLAITEPCANRQLASILTDTSMKRPPIMWLAEDEKCLLQGSPVFTYCHCEKIIFLI